MLTEQHSTAWVDGSSIQQCMLMQTSAACYISVPVCVCVCVCACVCVRVSVKGIQSCMCMPLCGTVVSLLTVHNQLHVYVAGYVFGGL